MRGDPLLGPGEIVRTLALDGTHRAYRAQDDGSLTELSKDDARTLLMGRKLPREQGNPTTETNADSGGGRDA